MIFYFSGTGNTEWVARLLASSIGERAVPIADEIDGECHYVLAKGERIGFCFPVHGWQPPLIVRHFIDKLTISQAKSTNYCFAVCTCGDNIGETIEILNKALRLKGLHTDSAFSVVMPNTYVCLPFMDTDRHDVEIRKRQQAIQIVGHIAKKIEDRERGILSTKKGLFPFLLSYVIGNFFNHYMITDKHFKVDKSLCTKCGRCAKACPANNIAATPGNTPEWLHKGKCTCCLSCYHHCPVHAIGYGKITKNKGQYYFTESKLQQIDAQI